MSVSRSARAIAVGVALALAVLGAARPYSLDNPFGAMSISRTGSSNLDLPTSAALRTCRVTTRNPEDDIVRELRCDPALMAVGEISTSRDGRNEYGHRVKPGRFTCTVSASGFDAALNSDGSHTAPCGTLTVEIR